MKAPVALTLDELKALLSVTKAADYDTYVLFLICVLHGLRVSEGINLQKHAFSFNGNTTYLTLQRLKGSEKTIQRLTSDDDPLLNAQDVVMKFIEKLDRDAHLFELSRFQASRLIEKYGTLAGIPKHKRFMHVFKHSCGTLMRKSGAKLEEIQTALGHKSLASTAQYLRVAEEDADDVRQKAFAAAPGR